MILYLLMGVAVLSFVFSGTVSAGFAVTVPLIERTILLVLALEVTVIVLLIGPTFCVL